MSLTGDLRVFAQNTRIRGDQVLRKVTIDITRDLVQMTPVDTGHARSNWFFGYQPVTSQDTSAGYQHASSVKDIKRLQKQSSDSKNGAPSIRRSMEFAQDLKAGGVFYITNNVDYIMALEFGSGRGPGPKSTSDGHSTQAPAGMARVTVARWQAYIDGALNQGTRSQRLESMRGAEFS